MTCRADLARRAQATADELAADPLIFDAETVPPQRGPRGEWTISIVVDAADRVPASVHRALAEAGVDTAWQRRQGPKQRILGIL